LNQWCTPPLRFQFSRCSTLLTIFDVPSTAGVCRESIECFTAVITRYLFSHLVAIPVTSVISGMTKRFIFHSHWISVLRILYYYDYHHYYWAFREVSSIFLLRECLQFQFSIFGTTFFIYYRYGILNS
jgi:hypothetical protein